MLSRTVLTMAILALVLGMQVPTTSSEGVVSPNPPTASMDTMQVTISAEGIVNVQQVEEGSGKGTKGKQLDSEGEGDMIPVVVDADDNGSARPMLLTLKGWEDEALDKHNALRAQHQNTPALTWSTAMAADAQSWANRGVYEHSKSYQLAPPAGPSGENIAKGYYSLTDAIQAWYDEVSNCQSLPGCEHSNGGQVSGGHLGHFTAMVWAGATELGCGVNVNSNFYVCRYRGGNSLSCNTPNMRTCYIQNVLPQITSGPTPPTSCNDPNPSGIKYSDGRPAPCSELAAYCAQAAYTWVKQYCPCTCQTLLLQDNSTEDTAGEEQLQVRTKLSDIMTAEVMPVVGDVLK